VKLVALAREHAGALAQVHGQAFEAPWSQDAFAQLLDSPGVLGMWAEAEDLGGFDLWRAAGGEAEVLTLAVRPARRRQGLARALLDAALGLARAAGAEQAFLEVAADNPAALALYQGADFVPAGRRPAYYARKSGPRVDALVLARDLKPGDA
jgi:ribosomal-protein-alanine N-acetyltransferase